MVTTAQGQAFITNGLLSYYPFHGNANDMVGTNNGIVVGATLTANRFGMPNAAYRFDGSTSYIQTVRPMQDLTNATFSLWFYANQIGAGASLFTDSTVAPGNDFACHLLPVGSTFGILIAGYKGGGSGSLTITQGVGNFTANIQSNWLHFVWVMQPTNQQLFLNGTLITNAFLRASDVGYHNAGFVFGANCAYTTYQDFFKGAMSDVRIYNRALSSNEVAQLYFLESRTLNIHRAVYVDSGILSVGTSYQFQVSSDLLNWTNQGAPFTATDSYWRPTNYWDVGNWNDLFFRLVPQ